MQIVIDIPNWLYDAMMGHREPIYSQSLGDAVRDGKPIPKGHGILIDTNEITAFKELKCNGHNVESLDEFTTILEADTIESED